MLYSFKKNVILSPSLPITATSFCPQGGRCGGLSLWGGSKRFLKMNLVEYKLGNICEVLAPVGSGGVAEQFSRALDLQFGGPEFKPPPTDPLKATLGK